MNFFHSQGARLAYRVDGPDHAPPLIMVNSLGTDMRMWDPQLPFLNGTLRLIRYDCRGHGASDAPVGDYTLEQLGSDLLALMDKLHLEQAAICGLSLGGIVALWCALTYPKRITRVVCANTAARIGTRESWHARIEAVRAGGMLGIRDAIVARFLSENYRQHHPETVQQISKMVEAINPQGYIGACAALREADLREQVGMIRIPSLILAGELDEATPPSLAQELHAAIAGSQLHIFRATAHLSNIERPKEFSEAILNFLAHA